MDLLTVAVIVLVGIVLSAVAYVAGYEAGTTRGELNVYRKHVTIRQRDEDAV